MKKYDLWIKITICIGIVVLLATSYMFYQSLQDKNEKPENVENYEEKEDNKQEEEITPNIEKDEILKLKATIQEEITFYMEKCTDTKDKNCIEEERKLEIIAQWKKLEQELETLETEEDIKNFTQKIIEYQNTLKEEKKEESSNVKEENKEPIDHQQTEQEKPSSHPSSPTEVPKATPKPTPKPTPVPTSTPISSELEQRLNSASLNPMKTGYNWLDQKIDSIIRTNTNSSMTTYQKVKALYDWEIGYMEYGSYVMNYDKVRKLINETGLQAYDAWQVLFAKDALEDHYGVCDNYSALFMILMRRLGLESYAIDAKNNDGGGHVTVNIKLNGTWYAFDPQGDDKSKKDGKIMYYFFGKQDHEIKKFMTYIDRNTSVNQFKNFAKIDKLTIAVTIGGKQVSLEGYDDNEMMVNGIMNLDFTPNVAIPIQISSSHEVSYNINNSSNPSPYFPKNDQGKITNGSIEYLPMVSQTTYLFIRLTDASHDRKFTFIFKINFKQSGKPFKVTVPQVGPIFNNGILLEVRPYDGVGDYQVNISVIETNDPGGAGQITWKPYANYLFNYEILGIKKEYDYMFEITATDSSGATASYTYQRKAQT